MEERVLPLLEDGYLRQADLISKYKQEQKTASGLVRWKKCGERTAKRHIMETLAPAIETGTVTSIVRRKFGDRRIYYYLSKDRASMEVLDRREETPAGLVRWEVEVRHCPVCERERRLILESYGIAEYCICPGCKTVWYNGTPAEDHVILRLIDWFGLKDPDLNVESLMETFFPGEEGLHAKRRLLKAKEARIRELTEHLKELPDARARVRQILSKT